MRKNIIIVKEFLDNIELLRNTYKHIHPSTYQNDYLFKIINTLYVAQKSEFDEFGIDENTMKDILDKYAQLKTYNWINDLLLDILNNNNELDPLKFTEEEVIRNGVLLENINEKIKLLETFLIKYNFEF